MTEIRLISNLLDVLLNLLPDFLGCRLGILWVWRLTILVLPKVVILVRPTLLFIFWPYRGVSVCLC